jgi:hypothetical protein
MAEQIKRFTADVGYQGSTEPVRFNPITNADLSSQLERNKQEALQSQQRVLDAAMQARRLQAAEETKTVKALAEFSPILMGALETGASAMVQADINNGLLRAAELVNQDEINEQNKKVQELATAEQLGLDVAKQAQAEGAPRLVVDQFAGLGAWGRYAGAVQYYGLAAKEWGSYLSSRLKEDEAAKKPDGTRLINDEVDASARTAYHLENFVNEKNFAGKYNNKVLMALHFLPTVRETNSKVRSSYEEKFGLERSFERKQTIDTEFFASTSPKFNNVSAFFSGYQTLLNPETKRPYTNPEIWQELGSQLNLGLMQKIFDTKTVEAWGEQADPQFPTKKIKDVRSLQFNSWQKQARDVKDALYKLERERNQQAAVELEDQLLAHLTGGEPKSESEWRETLKAALQASAGSGYAFTRLQTQASNFSRDAIKREQQMAEMEKLRLEGNYGAMKQLLENADIEVQKAYRTFVQDRIDEQKTPQYKQGINYVDQLVADRLKVTPDKVGAEGKRMQTQLQALFNSAFEANMANPAYNGNVAAASSDAQETVKRQFDAGTADPNSFFYIDKAGVAKNVNRRFISSGAVQAAQQKIDDAVTNKKTDAFKDTTLWGDANQNYNAWKQTGLIPPSISAAASKLGIEPVKAFDMYLKAAGKGGIPNVEALSIQRTQAPARVRQIIDLWSRNQATLRQQARVVVNPRALPVRPSLQGQPVQGSTGFPRGIDPSKYHPWLPQIFNGIPNHPFFDSGHSGSNAHNHLGFLDSAKAAEAVKFIEGLDNPYSNGRGKKFYVTQYSPRGGVGGHRDPGHFTGKSFDIPMEQVEQGKEIEAMRYLMDQLNNWLKTKGVPQEQLTSFQKIAERTMYAA